jgi:hypothetical protein
MQTGLPGIRMKYTGAACCSRIAITDKHLTPGVNAAIRFHDQNPHSGIDAFGMNKHYLAAPGHG